MLRETSITNARKGMPVKSVARVAAVAAKILGGFLLIAIALGAIYEHVAAWQDARVLKQVGRSVDIGGRRLNLYCIGQGSPTVVFESGRVYFFHLYMSRSLLTHKTYFQHRQFHNQLRAEFFL